MPKWHYLIINDKGITLNYLLKRRKFVSWDSIDRFKYNDLKESRKGWTILCKKDANRTGNYNEGAYTLFIPQSHVAASSVAVNEALKRGFQEHVWHGSPYQNDFNLSQIDGNPKKVYALCLIWIVLNLLYFCLDPIFSSHALTMEHTLVGGERFEGILSQAIFIVWMVSFSGTIPAMFTPVHEMMKTIAGFSRYWIALIAFTVIAATFSLPRNWKIYLNCSEPITNPIETVEAKVKEVDRDGIVFIIEYEGKSYKIKQGGYVKYVKGVYKGMPAVVKLQKGARGLPIAQEIAIPEIGWSVNLREDTATESAIPML